MCAACGAHVAPSRPPQLAASFISSRACNVGFWHLADILGAATFCPLSDNSGQRWILAGDGLSANDPERTLDPHHIERHDETSV